MKSNLHFKALRSAVAQQACHKVGESFKSYRQLAKLYREGSLDKLPKLPKYRKRNGLTAVSYPARWLKLINFLTTEESYTSRSNFLNNDELPTFGEKSERKHRFTGKRGQKIKGKLNNLGRGGYLTDDGIWLNSDNIFVIVRVHEQYHPPQTSSMSLSVWPTRRC